MHPGYLMASIAALAVGLMCFLTPNVLIRLGHALDRSVFAMEEVLLQRRGGRYVLGLGLFGLSLVMFRLSLLASL